MFSSVSWLMYVSVVSVAVGIYYLVIYLQYNSTQIRQKFLGKYETAVETPSWRLQANDESSHSKVSIAPKNDQNYYEQEADDTHEAFDKMFIEIKEFIPRAEKEQLTKTEILQYLGQIIKKYPDLKMAGIQDSITELILSELENYDIVPLSESEIEGLWHG